MKTDALQAAIYGRLAGDPGLVASLSNEWGFAPVFDHVPQVPDPGGVAYFPYLTARIITAREWDTDGTNGVEATVQVDVWSRARGSLEARQVAQQVYALLHKQPLTIAGAHHVWTAVESVEASTDPDGITRRAMIEARVAYDEI